VLSRLLLTHDFCSFPLATPLLLVANPTRYSTDFAGSWVAVYYEGFMGMDPGAWKHARQLPAGTAPAAGSSPQSTEQQYLLSLYWAFITTTTVGYGDIAPRNDAERGFVIFTAFCGCATFAYITGEIAALANAKNQRDIEYESKQRAVADFMNYYDFPRELRARVRRFYDTGFETGRFIDARQILRDLSLELRSEVGRYMKKVAVTRTPAMRKLGEPAQLEVAQSLHSRNIHAGHVLINRGEPAEQLFILDKGEVDVMSQRPRREGSAMLSHVQYGLAEGSVFGFTTPGFDFGHAWQVDVLATTDCEYFYLSLSAYEDIAELFPEVGAALARADACLIKLTRSANLVRDLARAKTATKSSKDATPQEAHWLSPALAGQTRALGGAPPVGGTPNLTTGGSPPAQRSRLGILQPIPSERTFSAEAAREASAGRGVLQREDSMAFSKHLRRNSGERGGTRTNSFGAGGGAKAASVQHAMLAATAHAAHAAHAAAMDGHVDQLREAGEAHAAALKEHAVANIKALEERSAAVLDAAATHAAAAGGGQASRQLEASVAAMRGELAELSTEVRAMGPSMDAKMQALRDGVKRDVMAALGGFLKRSALLQATSDTPTTHV
jgi:CRP-like cAMP-binding protein